MKSFELAHNVDLLNFGITAVSAAVTIGIFIFIIFFCVKYHNSKGNEYEADVQSTKFEIISIAITMIVFLSFYYWGSSVYKKQIRPLKPDYHVFVYAKQWMWKFHHQNGFVEIDHLHLPKDKKIKLVMLSKDVIHSFYLPVLRIKQDVLPDTFTYLNLYPEKAGEFPLFCAEYCGTDHSLMKGRTTIMPEKEYRQLTGMDQPNTLQGKGEKLFNEVGCFSCHGGENHIGPNLAGLSDDAFIRESILYPKKNITKGYQALMPSFKDQLSEEDIRALIEYVKKLRKK